MPNPQEIQRLRKDLGDANAMDTLYHTDPDFRATVDKYKAVMTNMSPVAEVKFPTAMLNKHYLKTFSPTKPVSPLTTQLANNVQTTGRVSQAAKQSVLESSSVQDPSMMGFAGNVLKSGGRLVRDVGSAILNPIDTAKGIGKAALGAGINAIETVAGDEQLFDNPLGSEDVASGIADFYVQRYGSLDALKKTAYEDPIGLISDVATVVTGAGGAAKGAASLASAGARAATRGAAAVPLASTAAKVGKAASTVGKFGDDAARLGMQMEPIVQAGKAVKGVAKGASNVGRFMTAQATGLAPDTISTIAKNPKFGDTSITRAGLGQKVRGAIQGLQDEVSDTGTGYRAFREGKQTTQLPKTLFRDSLKKQGFQLDDKGFVKQSFNGPQLAEGEIAEINRFLQRVDDLGEVVIDNQFLRVREALAKLAKYDRANRATNDIETVAKNLYAELNDKARGNLKGLEELDAKFGPQREFLDLIERDFIDPRTGELRDNAISRIANMKGKEGTEFVKRLKTIVPGIEEEVNALKAMEDVQLAGGQKVGAYMRGAAGAFVLSGGNPLASIAGAVLAAPSVATRLIRSYGKVAGLSSKTVSSILGKLKLGQKLSAEEAAIMSAVLQWAEIQESIPSE